MNVDQYEEVAADLDKILKKLRRKAPSNEELLVAMIPNMPKVKNILKVIPEHDQQRLYAKYPDFEYFLQLLTSVAEGIRDGTIEVPK